MLLSLAFNLVGDALRDESTRPCRDADAPFILRRLGYSLLILLGVTLITYLLLFMLPADPARQIAGRSAT